MSQTSQSVTDLFKQYLQRQMAAHVQGLGFADPDGLVVPHEAVPIQPVDPRLAWEDALAVVRWRNEEAAVAATSWETPPEWPSLVAAQEPAIALAFCVGNFPQLVRNLQPLLAGGDLSALRPPDELGNEGRRPAAAPAVLLEWANTVHRYPQLLLAAGVLRLTRRFKEASQLLDSQSDVPAEWRVLRANEEAALAWHRGHADAALTLWQAQKPTVPVLFNRGMAALFLGRPAEARGDLDKAVVQLPETSAWHHLGHLYLALTAARS